MVPFKAGDWVRCPWGIALVSEVKGEMVEVLTGDGLLTVKSSIVQIAPPRKVETSWGQFEFSYDCQVWAIPDKDRIYVEGQEYLVLLQNAGESLVIPYGKLPNNADGSAPIPGESSYKPFWISTQSKDKSMGTFKFAKGDKVVYNTAKVTGVIVKLSQKKCWIQPTNTVGPEDIIKGVPLDEIELYSSQPGPIEIALAQLEKSKPLPGEPTPKQADKGHESIGVRRSESADRRKPAEPTKVGKHGEQGDRHQPTKPAKVGDCTEPTKHTHQLDRRDRTKPAQQGKQAEQGDRHQSPKPAQQGKQAEQGDRHEPAKSAHPTDRTEQGDRHELAKPAKVGDRIEQGDRHQSVKLAHEADRHEQADRTEQVQRPEPATGNEQTATFWLPLDAIMERPEFQPRGQQQQLEKGIDAEAVAQYYDLLEYTEPPPLEVWFGQAPGDDEEKYYLISGHHRIRALRRAERERVECFQEARSYHEAVFHSSISNAGNGPQRQLLRMSTEEWAQACKNFLRVADQLAPDVIAQFLERAKLITGTNTWPTLNNSAIGAVFGVTRVSVGNYRKEIEIEREVERFAPGTRVLLVEFEKERFLLEQREHRLGIVEKCDKRRGLYVRFDSCRCEDGFHLPKDLLVVEDAPAETKLSQLGDRLWSIQGEGVVVAVEPDGFVWSSLYNISHHTPLVCLDSGEHQVLRNFDNDGPGEPLSVEQRLTKLRQFATDNPLTQQIVRQQIAHLESSLNCNPLQVDSSTVQDEREQRKALMGRVTPAGGNDAELPDATGINGKQPENPATTAVGVFERPVPARNLEQAQLQARRSGALTAIASLKLDLPVLEDDEIKDLLKAGEAELTQRHRPSQEGDAQRRQDNLQSVAS
ncbi:hypothetical protein [Laspinema palackyanum]|uniref:hypothetical protein n=1 Tax=Laspinema palackyanum TaxID=3231601 RepID=UPI00345DC43C|nr:hypothetical protein [Laspinema sp. D2c]